MKKVVVYLNGATGNQLFELFAGVFLASKHNAELILDESLLQPLKVRHPGGIEDFNIWLDGEPLKYKTRKLRKKSFQLLISRAIYKIMNSRKTTSRLTKQFRSKVTGFDHNLNLIEPPCVIFGFFQTYQYIDALKSEGHNLKIELASPSEWFIEMSQKIEESNMSVGIHLRRGDYVKYKDLIGVLTEEYFLGVLEEIETSRTIDKVFLFSDSTEFAEILRIRIGISKCLVIAPPNDLKPAESLMLFGLCDVQVISNSSFSWWGSYLGGNSNDIYAPEPWFRDQAEPIMLIPKSWKRRQSLWLD